MRTAELFAPFVSRRAVVLFTVFLCAGGLRTPLEAANGDVLFVSTALQGKDLADITLDPANSPPGGSFWALGKITGKIYHLSLDLNTVLGEIPNPHGPAVFPNYVLSWGIASRPLTKTLFVLAQDGPIWKVREVKTDGTEVTAGAFSITPPDGASAGLRGLAYDNTARELWCLDTNNDKLVRTGTDGIATKVCPLPGDLPAETTLRGDGLAIELWEVTPGVFEQRIYVSYGDIFGKDPSRLIQISDSCQETGIEVPLGKLALSGTPQGFQTFRTGQQRRVAIVTSEGKIVQIEQVVPAIVPPSQLHCALTLTNKVSLQWENNGKDTSREYEGEVVILRNGVPFTTLPGSTTQFTDATPLEGTSTYSLRASDTLNGPLSPESHPCRATVGTGGIVRWIPFPGISPYDAARDPSSGDIFVTDNVGIDGQGRIYQFDSALNLVGEVPSPWQRPGSITFIPKITISNQDLFNLLAVGRTDGSLLRLMDLTGVEKTTFGLEGATGAGSIGGLTYLPATQELVFLDQDPDGNKIVIDDATGRFRRECSPPPFLGVPPMDVGITYDPIQDTFLAAVEKGAIRELFTGGNCAPALPPFEISLESLGQGFDEPGFVSGVQIAANTVVVCGRASRALFQVLIFPSGPPYRRGDFDRSDAVNLTDAVGSAMYLFQAGPAPTCQDAADVNDDGILDVSDPVYLLFHLFLQGPPPPAPFPGAGGDPTFRDNLGCDEI